MNRIPRWKLRSLVVCIVVLAALIPGTRAKAAVILGVTPTFTSPVTVGDINQGGELLITNLSDGASSRFTVTLDSIRLTPACGSVTEPCANPELGVFDLTQSNGDGTALGTEGACTGKTFVISAPDATGQVVLTASDDPVVLGLPGTETDFCRIAFTFDVLRVPSIDIAPDDPRETFQVAAVEGTAADGVPGAGMGSNVTAVLQAVPTLTTQVESGAITIGATTTDIATLTGGFNPTGFLFFRLFGPDDADCSGPTVDGTPQEVAVNGNGNYSSEAITPPSPGVYRWVVEYTGDANNASAGPTACDDPNERVDVFAEDTAPVISVEKTANPTSLPEPGGSFSFTVQVTNTGLGPATINSIVDDVYGDLATRPGSTCGALVLVTLAPGETSAPCTFVADFTGNAGNSQTDVVTVNVFDPDEDLGSDTDDATVTITGQAPALMVEKTADPTSLPKPGGPFTFSVTLSNQSAVDPVTISSITDDIYGDLATFPGSTCGALIGTTLAPGAASAPCRFTASFTGEAGDSQTDIVTAVAVDDDGEPATDTDDATVTITGGDIPAISVAKFAQPATLPEPGGLFNFSVGVSNAGTLEPVTISSITDDIYGDLAAFPGSTCGALIGTTLAPGAASAPCSFTASFAGEAGDSQTDIVTVVAVDDDGDMATDTDDATVTITGDVPVISVDKTAAPVSLPEPGGTFTFSVTVSNESSNEPFTISSITDDIYGDLAAFPGSSCRDLIGTTLAPGTASAPCSFSVTFTGDGGESQTDTVAVVAVDDDSDIVADTDDATVNITEDQPEIVLEKSATPSSLPEPGGTFTFSVTVSNESSNEPVTISSITDDIYGDLATRPGSSCGDLIGTTLAAGASSAPCSFTATFIGEEGDSETDTVTVTVVDDDGDTAVDSDDFTIEITSPADPPPATSTPGPLEAPQPSSTFAPIPTQPASPSAPPSPVPVATPSFAAAAPPSAPPGLANPEQGSGTSVPAAQPPPVIPAPVTPQGGQDTVATPDLAAPAGTTAGQAGGPTGVGGVPSGATGPEAGAATNQPRFPDPTPPELARAAPGEGSSPVLQLSRQSATPGGEVRLTGSGCTPNTEISAFVGREALGRGVSDATGRFDFAVNMPALPVGRHEVVVECGPRLTRTIDIYTVTAVDPGASALVVTIFFILLALGLAGQRTFVPAR